MGEFGPAHLDPLVLYDLGSHLAEVNVGCLTMGDPGAIVHHGFVVQGDSRF